VPEGDTLHRTAAVLRGALAGSRVATARGRPGGAQLERVVGSCVIRVHAQGKHLLMDFDAGLTLHTHLGMHGAWHRYRPGERWRRAPSRALAVIEVPGVVAVCFDAPTVELIETRALGLHPGLASLGPDLLGERPDLDEAVRRLSSPERETLTIAEALLDQAALAGLGNVYRSEVLFVARQDPFATLRSLPAPRLESIVRTGAALIRGNVDGGARTSVPDALGAPPGPSLSPAARGRLYVYGRTGRPCRRCGAAVRSSLTGARPRRLYWCPGCQRPDAPRP
jgi:endonuclease VIII